MFISQLVRRAKLLNDGFQVFTLQPFIAFNGFLSPCKSQRKRVSA